MFKLKALIITIALVVAAAIFVFFVYEENTTNQTTGNFVLENQEAPQYLQREFPGTDFAKASVDFDSILSGGPGRDGIPAINNPSFTSFAGADFSDDILAVVLVGESSVKAYPYNILTWHEIVNDTFEGQPVAVTFCPLCGSALVFDRQTSSGVADFGVSGSLRESNMIMYDSITESFWQQSTGLGIVGEQTGEQLNTVKFQLLTIAQLRQNHPSAQILSSNTGFSRNYDSNPYSGYDQDEDLYFDVSSSDSRYNGKKIFVIFKAGDESVAVPWLEIEESKEYKLERSGKNYTLQKNNNELTTTESGQEINHYFEMWFSWVAQHPDDGYVFDITEGSE